MTDHDDVVRASFSRQVGLFSGPDSPFVRRPAGTVEQLEPLDDDMLVLDVCCGAAHAAEVVAPRVRQVVGVDLTVSLLELGAARLAAAGVGNVLLQEGNAQALPFVAGFLRPRLLLRLAAPRRRSRGGGGRDGAGRRAGRTGRAART